MTVERCYGANNNNFVGVGNCEGGVNNGRVSYSFVVAIGILFISYKRVICLCCGLWQCQCDHLTWAWSAYRKHHSQTYVASIVE